MSPDQVRLRRIESKSEIAPAIALAREFGDWASEQLRVELGILIPADADHPTTVLDGLLESAGRLYIAEADGEVVGACRPASLPPRGAGRERWPRSLPWFYPVY